MQMLVLILIAIIFVAVVLIIPRGAIKSTLKMEGSEPELSYVKKPYLMTNAEREFFFVLERAVQGRYYIVPQVELSNLVQVEKSKRWQYSLRNKIDRKSVDFVLFNKEYFTPYMAIELDDSSHSKEDRIIRDGFVDKVFDKAGVRIVHIKTAFNYDLNDISARILE